MQIPLPLQSTDLIFSIKRTTGTQPVGYASISDLQVAMPTIYSGDGSLAGTREVSLNNHQLNFRQFGSLTVQLDPTNQVIDILAGDENFIGAASDLLIGNDNVSWTTQTPNGADIVRTFWSASGGTFWAAATNSGGQQQEILMDIPSRSIKLIQQNTQFAIFDARKGYNFLGIQQFANNGAALAGGLLAGDVYRITGTDQMGIVH